MSNPTVLVVVPAKEHSARFPGKNVKELCGKPMLAYPIEAAKRARGVSRVIVSTESQRIKKIAQEYGAEVPFLRPAELTEDTTTSQEVVVHVLEMLKTTEGYEPDYVLLLYPTSPLLKSTRIEEAIALAIEKNADSVVSGHLDKGHYWQEMPGGEWERLYPRKGLGNSQYEKPLFVENGAIYLTRATILPTQIVADRAEVLLMDESETVDVDYPEDFAKVEEILKREQQ
jgi:CMP-N,N'-diacetyllegionaminic acid synthase